LYAIFIFLKFEDYVDLYNLSLYFNSAWTVDAFSYGNSIGR